MTAAPRVPAPAGGEFTDAEAVLLDRLDAGAELIGSDSAAASAALDAVATEASASGLPSVAARAAYLRARAEVARGALDSALELIEYAKSTWLSIGATVQALRTDLGRMHIFDDRGDHRRAIAVGEALVRAVDELGHEVEGEEARWLRAAALENVGVGHGYLGDHQRALIAYDQAESAYRAMGLEDEAIRPMANRGVELIELGRYADAIRALRTAAVGFDATGDHLSLARCLVYEARAQLLGGDYLAAAAASDAANGYLLGHSGGTDDARMQLVRADTFASLGLHLEALELYEALADRFEEGGLRHDRAWAWYGAANVLAALGRDGEAGGHFASAEHDFRAVGNRPMAAMARLGRTTAVPPAEGRRLAVDAIAELEDAERPAEMAATLVRLSRLTESPETALPFLARAREILSSLDLPHVRWQLEREEARWLRAAGDTDAALDKLLIAKQTVDSMRDSIALEQRRLPFTSTRRGIDEDILAILLDDGKVDQALEHSVRMRSRTLIERLGGAVVPGPIPTRNVELDAIYTDLLSAGSVLASSLVRRARTLEQKAAPPAEAHAVQFPFRGAEPTGTGMAIPTVVFETVSDEVLAFVIDDREVSVLRRLTTVGHVAGLLDRLDAQWRRFDDRSLAARQQRALLEASTDVLQQLYLALLARVPHLDQEQGLAIVPVGILANVPFAALHDGTCHLVERTALMIEPAPLGPHRPLGALSGSRRLVIGVEDEHVPWIRVEAETIARRHDDATVLINEEATIEALQRLAAEHDVIHLACHGLDRPDSPAFSALRLGDRWLTAAEVGSLDLDGQLIVLSACSSGRQRGAHSPDELSGLPRAFLAAGAGAVVANLWRVDDRASAELMSRFHTHLDRLPPALALRAAQLDLLERRPHPYLWGAGVIFGLQTARKEPS